jgi:hypothetical protein
VQSDTLMFIGRCLEPVIVITCKAENAWPAEAFSSAPNVLGQVMAGEHHELIPHVCILSFFLTFYYFISWFSDSAFRFA